MSIYVGCSGMPVKRNRYFAELQAVELSPSQAVPPRAETASKWRDGAPEDFVFCMLASRYLVTTPTQLPPGLVGDPTAYGGLRLTQEMQSLYERNIDAAVALQARVLVFVTSSQILPGPQGMDIVRKFFSHGDRKGLSFAWEPHGPWDDREVNALCEELNIIRCVDPLRDPRPTGKIGYARLGPFAALGRALADDELERIAERLHVFEDAYCFLATDRAFHDARRLRAMCDA